MISMNRKTFAIPFLLLTVGFSIYKKAVIIIYLLQLHIQAYRLCGEGNRILGPEGAGEEIHVPILP